jgi:hypothetical protein
MMLFDNQERRLNHINPPDTARKGWRRSVLNPFRLFLRITEYLAGPPVHEEISSLQDEADKWKQRASALEAEREELNQRVGSLQGQLERLKARETSLKKEREVVSRYAVQLESERDKLRRQQATDSQERAPEGDIQPVLKGDARPSPKRRATHAQSLRDGMEMQPGTFALLNEEGDGSGYGWSLFSDVRQERGAGSILDFAQKAVHDPVADQVLFCGAPHGATGIHSNKLVHYDVAAGKWTAEPAPGTWGVGCAYDTNTIHIAGREMYVSSLLRSNTLRRMNLDSRTWSSMAQPETIGFTSSEPSAEYFPERDELLWLQMKRLGAWKKSSNTWSLISPGLRELGWRSAIARHNPVLGCVLILGGADTDRKPAVFSHAVYKYDKNGAITRMKDSPPSINVYTNRSLVTVDPISGDFLFIQAVLLQDINDFTRDIEFWKYRIDTDTWTRLHESVIPAPEGWWAESYPAAVVAAPIPKYGVILFMSAAPGSKSKAYLYKHS